MVVIVPGGLAATYPSHIGMLGNPQGFLLSLDRKEDGSIPITPGIGGGRYDSMGRIIGNPELKKQNREVQ